MLDLNNQNNDVALVVTVYPPYSILLNESISEIERHWPDHPPLTVGQDKTSDLTARIAADLRQVNAEFVVVMCEDFRLCAPVKQDLFNLCLDTMRTDPSLISCSLTWEPSDVGTYHYPKRAHKPSFQILPIEWNYAINFQVRIWRRELLMKILAAIPPNTKNAVLEPLATKLFRRLLPGHRAITYAFPDPPNPSTFIDTTDKSAWIVPYRNLFHAGKLLRH